MSVYSALACFFSVLLCLLKQSWIDSKDFFTIFCWPDHHPTLVMSADCLLGTLLADLLISVVLFFCQCLFGESVDVCLDWAQVFFLPIFSSDFNRCLAWSVSQRLMPNLFEGITWCLPGSTQYLSCLCLSDGFGQCLFELVLTVSFCQRLLGGTCWCLSGLNSRVFLPVSF